MKIRNKLFFASFLISGLIISLMGCFMTALSFSEDVLNEKDRLGERMNLIHTGLLSAYAGYSIQGIEPDLGMLESIVLEYDDHAGIREEKSIEAITVHKSGKRLFAQFGITLGRRDYTVSSFYNIDHIYDNQMYMKNGYRIMFFLAFFALMSAMYILADRILKPVKSLTEAAAAFSNGDKDARASVTTNDELYEMALTFNCMADSISGEMNRQQAFIQNLTHEMKTPLSAIMGHADLIRTGKAEGAEAMLAAQTVLKEASRLDALSQRLTGLILMENDQGSKQKTSVLLLLSDVASAFQTRDIDIACSGEDAVIVTDRVLMKTMLMNLVDNAINAGAKHVQLKSEKGDFIRVLDDGCGMTHEQIQKATQPFWRADKARSRAHGGAGLGLALCERIARLTGCKMTIDSEIGKGTTISIALQEVKTDAQERESRGTAS